MSHLCEGLSTLSTLRVLHLSENSLGIEGTRHLGKGRLCKIQACVKSAGNLLLCRNPSALPHATR